MEPQGTWHFQQRILSADKAVAPEVYFHPNSGWHSVTCSAIIERWGVYAQIVTSHSSCLNHPLGTSVVVACWGKVALHLRSD